MNAAIMDQPAAEQTSHGAIGPQAALPGGRMIATVVTCGAAVVLGWLIAMFLKDWPAGTMSSGLLGAGVVVAFAIAGTLLISPWKVRPVSAWMTWWLGLTVFRLFLTPVGAWVLYSAASSGLNPKAFALAVGLTYLTTVVAEALVVSVHLRRKLPA